MKLATRDRVGFYIVPLASIALGVQIWIGNRTDDLALYVFITAALLLSATPFVLTFPASWRGEVSARMIEKVPWSAAISALPVAFFAAAITEVDSPTLRVGAIAAGAGMVNLITLRLIGGKGSLATPSRWTKISVMTGVCIGFFIGFVSTAPLELVGNATCFGLYVAASHWLVRSVIDISDEIEPTGGVAR